MKYTIIFLFAMITFSFHSCKTMKEGKPSIKQGVFGRVLWKQGNMMPSPGALKPSEGMPVVRTIKIYAVAKFAETDGQVPLFKSVSTRLIATVKTNTNKLYSGGSLGLNLSGSTLGNGRVALWDGGGVLATHVEFGTSRILKKDAGTTTDLHSTHVAGTMAATGVYPLAKGMAFGLPQLLSFDFGSDLSEMSANASTLLISNHSYGIPAGWSFNDTVTPNRWEFLGPFGANEDYKFGYYDNTTANWDLICYNAPYYLPVKSAGNVRNSNGPDVGEPYYRYSATGVMSNAGNRPAGISSNNGYDILSTYANAKNTLIVGAINPLPNGAISPASIQISSFSSWGPTDDGRIKPDLVGNGVSVTSTSNANTSAYATLSGTSMSAPNVSGSLALLQELYSQRNSGSFMRSATLKALVLGTATEAGSNPGPDYIFGWGLLNTEEAAKAILNKGTRSIITENSLAQGGTQTVNVIASGNGPFIATICWTDPEATPVSTANALNNTTPRLVNDLDIRVNDGTTTFRPWILDPANPSAAATTGDNFRDNVEQIYIANAVPGKSYAITITHKGTLQRGSQAFSLVATGVGGANYCSSTPSSSADSKITNFKLANLDYTSPNGCTTYTNLTSQTIEVEKGQTYPLSLSVGTCATNFSKIAKVFVDWNADGDFDDTNELVGTSAVITATGTFTANVTVPTNVEVNNFSLLRIGLTETTSAAAVTACGSYAKGETQDYRIKFINSSIDVAPKAITNLVGSICANASQSVTVTLRNNGTQTLTNIPITATVSENGITIATLQHTYAGTLTSLSEVDVTLLGSFNAQAGRNYLVTVTTNLTTDLNTSNNQTSATVQVSNPPTATNLTAYFCTSINAFALNGTGENLFWYKNPTDITPIAFGNVTTTTTPADNAIFYAGVNEFSAGIGPKTKSTLGDGTYNQFTPDVTVTTLAPITLESARLYIGNSGQIRFTVKNSSNVAVSSVLLNVTATKTVPAAGLSSNDLNDQGQVYTLNLTIPSAGTFNIAIEYLNGATIFRNNNLTSTSYPYATALNLFSLNGNTATLDGSPNYFRTFYYYFYDLKVKSPGCVGASRLAVPLTTVSISQNGNVLTSSATSNNQWFLNGTAIKDATNQSYTATTNGNYTVETTVVTGCSIGSNLININSFNGSNPNLDINLKTYPVPTDNELNIAFSVYQADNVNVMISNLLGQIVFKDEKVNYSGNYTNKVNLSNYPAGIYVLQVKVGSETYVRKISLAK